MGVEVMEHAAVKRLPRRGLIVARAWAVSFMLPAVLSEPLGLTTNPSRLLLQIVMISILLLTFEKTCLNPLQGALRT